MVHVTSAFDAIILGTTSGVTVCGLTLVERARRVALKAGASRVLVVEVGATHTEQIEAWAAAEPSRPLVAIDATDHVVHVPLVQAVMTTGSAIAVDERGAFGGAIWAEVGRRDALIAASTSAASLAALAPAWRTEGVPAAPYGELSRHPARTAAERRGAVHFLFGLIRKSQDSWLVRTINRKVSYPFTRLLLPITALTPNMISIIVFLIGAFGCLVLTTPTYEAAVVGTGLLLFAGYLDGCDGEVARIRLESSKLGAWIDTMADEATTVLSVICVGIHAYRLHPSTWLAWVVAIAAVMAVISVLSIYYYLLTSGGSGNSQDYPTTNPILNVLRYIIRREAINLGSFVLCVFGQILVLYVILAVGAAVSSSVLVTQQIQRTRARRTAEPTQAG